jgi:hypothetical protein
MFMVQTAPPLPPLNGAPPRDRAIVATLLYYDLFSFPLRADELVRFAPDPLALYDLPKEGEWWDSRPVQPNSTGAFWFLKGREDYIQRRVELTNASSDKLQRARKFARLLQLVPGVRFIGVTGSLAMESAVPEDDIDFLVISAKNRLWLTRALVLSALIAWGVKRPDDGRSEYPNLICANIFLSKGDLYIPDENLFIAHEICQMLPLLGESTYRSFLNSNAWVKQFLPQWQPPGVEFQDRSAWRSAQKAFEVVFSSGIGARIDRELARRQLQRIESKHARGHNPNVKITPTQLRFHARDLSDYVVNTFNARWNALNLH